MGEYNFPRLKSAFSMLPYQRFHTFIVCLGYLLVYGMVMGALSLWYSVPGRSGNPLKSLDVQIYSELSKWNEAPKLDPRLLVIDLPYFKNGDLTGYREKLGNLLQHLARLKSDGPEVVVLDIAIQSDNSGLKAVHNGPGRLSTFY